MRRIIPARAGFTVIAWERESHPKDHPRSRGVYAPGDIIIRQVGGSSPLARGLLLHLHRPDLTPRIIPARAGFTSDFILIGQNLQDHPRSRGVYEDQYHDPYPR